MSYCFISDIHIQFPGDEKEKLFLSFLNSAQVQNCTEIFLLGDIFDLLVGSYEEYLAKFYSVFEALGNLVLSGKRIHFFEGNHDFHANKLWQRVFEILNTQKKDMIKYHIGPYAFKQGHRSIVVCHGDELDYEDRFYQLYRKCIKSKLIELLLSEVISFQMLEFIGQRASKNSKKRNKQKYVMLSDDKVYTHKYRRLAKLYCRTASKDVLICGHSHVRDLYCEVGKFVYSNNGYFPVSRVFTHLDDHGNLEHVIIE